MKNLEEFKKIFSANASGFWSTIINKTLINLGGDIDKPSLLNELHSALQTKSYYPSKPRGHIVYNKGNSVARLVPVFQPRDICVYFYCINALEPYIYGNRVPYTYGGWTLGGRIRNQEDEEISGMHTNLHTYEDPDGNSIVMDETGEYSVESSFDPSAWMENWGQFTRNLYHNSVDEPFRYVAEIDIANFYDSIRLDILEVKIRSAVDINQASEVSLLFHFLRYWNRDFNNYDAQNVGIPQDEVGDCSRILANFYLQEYDLLISAYCESVGGKYMRYADDQVFFAQSKRSLDKMILMASMYLHQIGLRINQKKVKIMSKLEFDQYYCFDIFMKIRQDSNSEMLESALSDYKSAKKEDLRHGGISVLLRLLKSMAQVGRNRLNEHAITELLNFLLTPTFLSSPKLSWNYLFDMYNLMPPSHRPVFIILLDSLSMISIHNSFHYNLLKFKNKIMINTDSVELRILELSQLYPHVVL